MSAPCRSDSAHSTPRALLAEDRRGEAIQFFSSAVGLPAEVAGEMSRDPKLLAMAPTVAHDYEVVGDVRGGTVPEGMVRSVRVPTLVIAGGESPDFFRVVAARIAELLPNAKHVVLDGQDHGASPGAVAPVVTRFLAG